MNTALLICFAFIFRLLFVNILSIYSSDTQQNRGIIKKHFSTVMKRSKHFEAADNVFNPEYALADVCEENADDDKFKSKPHLPSTILYFLIEDHIKNNPSAGARCYQSFSFPSSQLYLSLQVFRI